MFALRRRTEHRDVGHDDHVVLAARRQFIAEHVHALLVEAEGAVFVVYDVDLLPCLAGSDRQMFEMRSTTVRTSAVACTHIASPS